MFACLFFAASTRHSCPWTSGRTTRTTSTPSMTSTGSCTREWRASPAASPSWTAMQETGARHQRVPGQSATFCCLVLWFNLFLREILLGLWIYVAPILRARYIYCLTFTHSHTCSSTDCSVGYARHSLGGQELRVRCLAQGHLNTPLKPRL